MTPIKKRISTGGYTPNERKVKNNPGVINNKYSTCFAFGLPPADGLCISWKRAGSVEHHCLTQKNVDQFVVRSKETQNPVQSAGMWKMRGVVCSLQSVGGTRQVQLVKDVQANL